MTNVSIYVQHEQLCSALAATFNVSGYVVDRVSIHGSLRVIAEDRGQGRANGG